MIRNPKEPTLYHTTFRLAAIVLIARLWLLGPVGIDREFVQFLAIAVVTVTVGMFVVGELAALGRKGYQRLALAPASGAV